MTFFTSIVDPHFLCAVCGEVAKTASCTKQCLHLMGFECAMIRVGKNKKCPVCQNHCELTDVEQNPWLQRCIMNLQVKCECGEIGSLERIVNVHKPGFCPLRKENCRYCGVDVFSKEMEAHAENLECACGEMVVKCIASRHTHFNCEKCKMLVPEAIRKSHVFEQCIYRTCTCPYCHVTVPFAELELHDERKVCEGCGRKDRSCLLNAHKIKFCDRGCKQKICLNSESSHESTCLRYIIACKHAEADCEVKLPREDMQAHENDHIFHINLLEKSIKNIYRDASNLINQNIQACDQVIATAEITASTSSSNFYSGLVNQSRMPIGFGILREPEGEFRGFFTNGNKEACGIRRIGDSESLEIWASGRRVEDHNFSQ